MASPIPSSLIPSSLPDGADEAVWGIVLAAGSSRRMGAHKALLPWGDGPLVAAHVRSFAQVGLAPLVVVAVEEVAEAARIAGARVVHTHGTTPSPFASLRRALAALPAPRGAVVSPVDVAPADADLLAALTSGEDLVPVGPDGRDGHPVRLSGESCRRIRQGDREPEHGLRTLLRTASRVRVAMPCSDDFDTWDAWLRRCPSRLDDGRKERDG